MILNIKKMCSYFWLLGSVNAVDLPHYTSYFAKKDFSELGNRLSDKIHFQEKELYEKAFGTKFKFDDGAIRQFSLSSGIEIRIDLELCISLNENFFQTFIGRNLGAEFETHTIKEKPCKTVQLRHVYGYKCDDNFRGEPTNILILALLNPGKPAKFSDGSYVLNVEPTEILSTPLVVLAIARQSVQLVIRYRTPANKAPEYAVFIKNENPYDLNYGSEIFLANFTVEQEIKVFSTMKS